MVNLITYTGKTRTALHDAITFDVGVGGSGIFYGCEVTAAGNVLTIGNGYGIIKGRVFEIQQEDFNVRLQDGVGVSYGHLILTLDLSNAENPLTLALTQDIYENPTLTKDENANYDSGIYQLEIATCAISSIEIADVVVRANKVHGGVKVITETDWYMGDIFDDGWYYFDHVHTPEDAPGTLVNGWLRVLSGGNAKKQILFRQGSENTQADTFVRTFTEGAWTSWRRLVSEKEMYFMPGDRIDAYFYTAGTLTSGNTSIAFDINLPKPLHSSVRSVSYVGTGEFIQIRQNGKYLANDVKVSTLSPSLAIRPNTIYCWLNKPSGFGGTNNDTVAITGHMLVQFNG